MHGPGFEGSRNQAELEAESVAYVICGVLGIDCGQYSWGYLASWGADPATIRQSGQRIQKTVQTIIEAMGAASGQEAA